MSENEETTTEPSNADEVLDTAICSPFEACYKSVLFGDLPRTKTTYRTNTMMVYMCGQKSRDSEIERLKLSLADSIRRPMGVIPDSAVGLLTQDELNQAELRRANKC